MSNVKGTCGKNVPETECLLAEASETDSMAGKTAEDDIETLIESLRNQGGPYVTRRGNFIFGRLGLLSLNPFYDYQKFFGQFQSVN